VTVAALAPRAIAAALALMSVASAAGGEPPASISVPFRAGRDRFVLLDATVNGRYPVRTLLDTGDAAPYDVLMTPALSARTGTRPTGDRRTSRAAIGPASVTFRSVALRSFAIGPLRVMRPTAADSPAVARVSGDGPRRFDAVVGGVFLRNHRVAIDYARQRVTFDGPVPSGAPLRFAFAPRRPAVIVQAPVTGVGPFAFVLDTGAAATILSSRAARLAGLRLGRPVPLYGGGGRTRGVRTIADEIRAGSTRRTVVRLVVADVLGAASTEVGMRLDGILGAPFFAAGVLTIDYPHRAVWIGDRSPGGSP
jgi:predicted aspartyl protease